MGSSFLKITLYTILLWNIFSSHVCTAQAITNRKDTIQLIVHTSGKDTSFVRQRIQMKTLFPFRREALAYLDKIPDVLAEAGYLASSVDSFWEDPTGVHVPLFYGPLIHWAQMDISGIEQGALDVAGFNPMLLKGRPVDLSYIKGVQDRLLQYYQNHGYPFTRIRMDSVRIFNDSLYAHLFANKSILYLIDSIRVYGKARMIGRAHV